MALACITYSPTLLNLGDDATCQLEFPSVILLFTESRDLTTYKSLVSIWCEIKYSYESYLWMVNWFDNPPLSRIRKEKLMVLFFGLQLTSCNLQCIKQSLLDLNLTWSNAGYVSFHTRVSPSARNFYYDHHALSALITKNDLWEYLETSVKQYPVFPHLHRYIYVM